MSAPAGSPATEPESGEQHETGRQRQRSEGRQHRRIAARRGKRSALRRVTARRRRDGPCRHRGGRRGGVSGDDTCRRDICRRGRSDTRHGGRRGRSGRRLRRRRRCRAARSSDCRRGGGGGAVARRLRRRRGRGRRRGAVARRLRRRRGRGRRRGAVARRLRRRRGRRCRRRGNRRRRRRRRGRCRRRRRGNRRRRGRRRGRCRRRRRSHRRGRRRSRRRGWRRSHRSRRGRRGRGRRGRRGVGVGGAGVGVGVAVGVGVGGAGVGVAVGVGVGGAAVGVGVAAGVGVGGAAVGVGVADAVGVGGAAVGVGVADAVGVGGAAVGVGVADAVAVGTPGVGVGAFGSKVGVTGSAADAVVAGPAPRPPTTNVNATTIAATKLSVANFCRTSSRRVTGSRPGSSPEHTPTSAVAARHASVEWYPTSGRKGTDTSATVPALSNERVVIVGAGPCGIACARELQRLGHHDFVVLERADGPGGLAASVVDQAGFTWDRGGHVVFSHYGEFDRLLEEVMGDDVLRHERSSYVHLGGDWVPYPVQNNLHRMPRRHGGRVARRTRRSPARARTSSATRWPRTGLRDLDAIDVRRWDRSALHAALQREGVGPSRIDHVGELDCRTGRRRRLAQCDPVGGPAPGRSRLGSEQPLRLSSRGWHR